MSGKADGAVAGAGDLVITLPATLEAIPPAQARLGAFLRARGAGARIVGRAELLLEELVTNVIRHGGLAAPEAARLTLAATIGPGQACRLVFEDPGRPFDPAAAALPDLPTRLEEARIGGLGLVLLQRMARDLDYVRLPDGRNQLTLLLDEPAGR